MFTAELNQSLLRGGQRLPHRAVSRVLRVVGRAVRPGRARRVSVAFVSEKEIRRLNKAYRGKDAVTDVLSFGNEGSEGSEGLEEDEGSLGEILICYPRARRQAAELHHSIRDEVLFLLVHGLLHLSGYDHERPADAKRMFSLQTHLLESLGIDPRL